MSSIGQAPSAVRTARGEDIESKTQPKNTGINEKASKANKFTEIDAIKSPSIRSKKAKKHEQKSDGSRSNQKASSKSKSKPKLSKAELMERNQAQSKKSKMDKDTKAIEVMQKYERGELPRQIKQGNVEKTQKPRDESKKTARSQAKSQDKSQEKLEISKKSVFHRNESKKRLNEESNSRRSSKISENQSEAENSYEKIENENKKSYKKLQKNENPNESKGMTTRKREAEFSLEQIEKELKPKTLKSKAKTTGKIKQISSQKCSICEQIMQCYYTPICNHKFCEVCKMKIEQEALKSKLDSAICMVKNCKKVIQWARIHPIKDGKHELFFDKKHIKDRFRKRKIRQQQQEAVNEELEQEQLEETQRVQQAEKEEHGNIHERVIGQLKGTEKYLQNFLDGYKGLLNDQENFDLLHTVVTQPNKLLNGVKDGVRKLKELKQEVDSHKVIPMDIMFEEARQEFHEKTKKPSLENGDSDDELEHLLLVSSFIADNLKSMGL